MLAPIGRVARAETQAGAQLERLVPGVDARHQRGLRRKAAAGAEHGHEGSFSTLDGREAMRFANPPTDRQARPSPMADDAIQVGDKVVVLQVPGVFRVTGRNGRLRSEEHTSELQSLTNLVCRLLLEK